MRPGAGVDVGEGVLKMGLLQGFKGAARGMARARNARMAREQASGPGRNDVRPDDWMFCKSCGHEGRPDSDTPGSTLIELVLWLFFIIPGLVYSLWRLNQRHKVCSACSSADIIPSNSPMARTLRKQISS